MLYVFQYNRQFVAHEHLYRHSLVMMLWHRSVFCITMSTPVPLAKDPQCGVYWCERAMELLVIRDAVTFTRHHVTVKLRSETIDVITSFHTPWWRHQMEIFSALLPFLRGFHRSPVNYPHKGQWRGALMFTLICVWINGWVKNREAGDLKRYRAHYDVIVTMFPQKGFYDIRHHKTQPKYLFVWILVFEKKNVCPVIQI